MRANKIIDIILTLTAWIVIPIQLLSTFILGILVKLTFGLLLIPISLIWSVLFLGPLLGLSWLWKNVPLLRIPLTIIGIPIAVIGDIYIALMPSMGETENRVTKMLLCQTWPYTLECWEFISNNTRLSSDKNSDFERILSRLAKGNVVFQQYLHYKGKARAATS